MSGQENGAQIEARATQFSTYVQMAEALSDRQGSVIRYYITLHTAIIGAGGAAFIASFDRTADGGPIYLYLFLLLICLTGRFFCGLWREALVNLRYWEGLKYKIIRTVEEEDPTLIELYAREWKADGKSTKARSRERVLALPAAFLRFYWLFGLLIVVAFAIKLDTQFFGGQLINAIDGLFPGARELLT